MDRRPDADLPDASPDRVSRHVPDRGRTRSARARGAGLAGRLCPPASSAGWPTYRSGGRVVRECGCVPTLAGGAATPRGSRLGRPVRRQPVRASGQRVFAPDRRGDRYAARRFRLCGPAVLRSGAQGPDFAGRQSLRGGGCGARLGLPGGRAHPGVRRRRPARRRDRSCRPGRSRPRDTGGACVGTLCLRPAP